MSPGLTKGVIVVIALLLVLYDVAAVAYGGKESSISVVLAEWASANLIIAVAFGVLIGHWFWPL